MEWRSNAKYGQPVESGSIFTLKSAPVQIHRIHGVDGTWYLSCTAIGISQKNLNTDSFDEAVEKAKVLIKSSLENLRDTFLPVAEDTSKTEITRY